MSAAANTILDEPDLGRLMAAAQAGDRVAYDRLLRECLPTIRRIARYRGAPPASIDDIVQDVLLTIHRVRHTYDPGRPFSAWLSAIAERRTIDLLRRHGRSAARELHAPILYENHPDEEASPELLAEDASDARQLGIAIATLPDGQRQAVQTVLSGNSLAEAEVLTGRSRTALKVNFHRAIKGLRARMSGGATGT